MDNKSTKAIVSLKTHLSNINSISSVVEGNTWKASLKDTINLFNGTNSSISQRLDKLYFTKKEHHTIDDVNGIFSEYIYEDSNKENFKNLILTAIKNIELNGIYKNPNKRNFLNSFNNKEIISGTVFIALLIFGIGNYFGRIEKDKESLKIEESIKKIEKENIFLKEINDSLKIVSKSLPKIKK